MRIVVASIAVSALGACATEQWIYQKPGLTPAQLDADKAVCRREAPAGGASTVMNPEAVDRRAFNRCMERRGYNIRLER